MSNFLGGLDDVELLKIGNGTPKKDDLDRSAKKANDKENKGKSTFHIFQV